MFPTLPVWEGLCVLNMTTNMCHKQIKLILINQDFEDWNFYETVRFAVVLSCINASTQHSYMNENTVNSIPFCVSADQQIILICTFQETLPKIKEYCPFTVSDTNALDTLFLLPLHKCCSGSSRSSMAFQCHPQCHSRVRVGKCTPQPFKAC